MAAAGNPFMPVKPPVEPDAVLCDDANFLLHHQFSQPVHVSFREAIAASRHEHFSGLAPV